MPWFKVDDNLAFHHKVLAAGNPAMGLWVRAGSACAQQLTDGFVPEHLALTLGTAAQAKKLVSVGLWDLAQGGYRFHEWGERQPSKVNVEAERAAAAERMKAYRAKRKGTAREESPQASDSRSEDVRPNERRTNAVRSEEVREPRPSPSPSPDPSCIAADAAKPKRAMQRPADFRPAQSHIDLANELGVDLRAEWQQFCDHHDAKGSTYKDWPAALRTWIRNAAKFGRSRSSAGTSRQQADADMFARQMARAEAREAQARGEIA